MTNDQSFYTSLAILYSAIFVAYAIAIVLTIRSNRKRSSGYVLASSTSAMDRLGQRNFDLQLTVNQLSYRVAYLEGC